MYFDTLQTPQRLLMLTSTWKELAGKHKREDIPSHARPAHERSTLSAAVLVLSFLLPTQIPEPETELTYTWLSSHNLYQILNFSYWGFALVIQWYIWFSHNWWLHIQDEDSALIYTCMGFKRQSTHLYWQTLIEEWCRVKNQFLLMCDSKI